jgi:secondary thiamine-phosphate synthase enzyme
MPVYSSDISLSTKGHMDIADITEAVSGELRKSGVRDGVVTLFCVGSTGGLTTVEYEPGLVRDLKAVFEKLAPYAADYSHHATWNDDNGAGHVRASLLGPSLSVPVTDGRLTLGTWQQIIFIDFDTRPRKRTIVLKIIS